MASTLILAAKAAENAVEPSADLEALFRLSDSIMSQATAAQQEYEQLRQQSVDVGKLREGADVDVEVRSAMILTFVT